jgi:hypothetical protein
VFVKEEVIAGVIQEQTYLSDLMKEEREKGEEQLKALDAEIVRLNRKERLQEAALVEQLDNMNRRIEYEQVKNGKVKKLIEVEQAKIDKIKD